MILIPALLGDLRVYVTFSSRSAVLRLGAYNYICASFAGQD